MSRPPSSPHLTSKGEQDSEHLRRTIFQIRAYQSGEKDAAESLFRRYAPIVQRIVSYRLGHLPQHLADFEDLTQEALMAAFRSLGSFEPTSEANFKNWLARIVQDKVADSLRRDLAQKRGSGRVVRMSELGEAGARAAEPEATGPSPSRASAEHELEATREAAMLRLSDYHREVITLRDHCGMRFQEITDELKLAGPDAARMAYRRAMRKLQETLRGHVD